jgi:beta-galactosidase/beta-glucuronidase
MWSVASESTAGINYRYAYRKTNGSDSSVIERLECRLGSIFLEFCYAQRKAYFWCSPMIMLGSRPTIVLRNVSQTRSISAESYV